MSVDLSSSIKNLYLKNPTMLASGILGINIDSLKKAAQGGAGAVVLKSLTSKPRKGHSNPILIQASEEVFMNAVGYENKGIKAGIKEFQQWKEDTPLIGNIVGGNAKEFAKLSERIQKIPIQALEVVLSCPHTPGYGLMAGQGTPEATAEITKAVRKTTKLPLFIKLSPSIEPVGEIAKAAESEGADAINMGNTLGPGMKINIEQTEPILDFKIGGLSGPAIRPVMLRAVYDIYQAVKIPIIATGGITAGRNAIEAFMAGATAIQIGTGVYYRGADIFSKVTDEIKDWMKKNSYKTVSELIGLAHEK